MFVSGSQYISLDEPACGAFVIRDTGVTAKRVVKTCSLFCPQITNNYRITSYLSGNYLAYLPSTTSILLSIL